MTFKITHSSSSSQKVLKSKVKLVPAQNTDKDPVYGSLTLIETSEGVYIRVSHTYFQLSTNLEKVPKNTILFQASMGEIYTFLAKFFWINIIIKKYLKIQ